MAAGALAPRHGADRILIFPDARLRDPCARAASLSASERTELVDRLVRAMRDADGVGLAAPQIGISIRAFVLDSDRLSVPGRAPIPTAFLDPEPVGLSVDEITMDEGCLSFPSVSVPIRRPARARLRATGLDGASFEVEGGGLLGRALQHELDHLVGRLMVDVVSPIKREMIRKKMRALARR